MSDIRRLHERIADLEVQLSTKMDEIERLTAERDEANRGLTAYMNELAKVYSENDEAKATIERLRELLKPFAESAAYYDVFGIYGGVPVRHLREAREALLKPDTGEKLIAELHVSGTKEEWLAALAANREDAALKPDTGE